jgi:hypothetical protein
MIRRSSGSLPDGDLALTAVTFRASRSRRRRRWRPSCRQRRRGGACTLSRLRGASIRCIAAAGDATTGDRELLRCAIAAFIGRCDPRCSRRRPAQPFLVGAIAGRVTKTKRLGFVGGMKIPLIRKFEAGVKQVCPDCAVLSGYAGNEPKAFAGPIKGKELALAQYGRGVDIIYHASGKTGDEHGCALPILHEKVSPVVERPGRQLVSPPVTRGSRPWHREQGLS